MLIGTVGAASAQTDPAPSTTQATSEPQTGSDQTVTTDAGATASSSTTATSASTTTLATTTTVAGAGAEDAPAPAGDDGTSGTTIPPGPPPGFTQEQYDTFVNTVTACGGDPGIVCSRLLAWTGNENLAEAAQWIFDLPIKFLLVLVAAWLINKIARRFIARSAESWQRRNSARTDGEHPDVSARQALRITTASATLMSAASIVIYTAAAFVALAQLNIDLAPLLAGAGIIGVALGFGAQNMVRDYLAGIFVIVEDQYGIGDTIDFGKAIGDVEGISLRMTKVRDLQGTLWFVPNGIITEVGNMSQRWARVILDVDVAYGADHHQAERLIKEAADEMWNDTSSTARLLEEPQMWGIQALGENSVQIRIAIKCAPARQWAAARELRSRIKDRFDEAGIEIPFPQRTMWIRTEGGDPASAGFTRTEDAGPRGGHHSGGSTAAEGPAAGDGPPDGSD